MEGPFHTNAQQSKGDNPEDEQDGIVDQGDERRESEAEVDNGCDDKIEEGKERRSCKLGKTVSIRSVCNSGLERSSGNLQQRMPMGP